MARTKSSAEIKTERIVTLMTRREVAALDDWMFANRLRSRGEAIRQLVKLGMGNSAYDEMCAKSDAINSMLDRGRIVVASGPERTEI